MKIPIIDFEKCGLLIENENEIDESSFAESGKELFEAFSTSGFAYIKNHGIPDQILDDLNEVSDRFFASPLEYKMNFCTKSTGLCYDPVESVNTNPKRLADYVEGLRIPAWTGEDKLPDIENLKEAVDKMQKLCKILTFRIFKALGRGMKLKDEDLFYKSHQLIGKKGNTSLFKLLHYPALADGVLLKENQLRCGEHADLGSLTILFQDANGGLQCQTPEGNFVDAPHIEGTALLNVGDMLQFWCGKKLKSTVHRVVLPEQSKLMNIRRCHAYFAMVDNEVTLSELDFEDTAPNKNIEKGEVMTSQEYWTKRFAAHFFLKK